MTFPRIGIVWWALALLALWASYSRAAPLTEVQLATLKQDILASADLADEVAVGNAVAIADAYNLPAVPDYWAWRTSLSKMTIYGQPSPTGSVWSWTVYNGLTVPQQNSWSEMFGGATGTTDYSLANIRAGVAALFTGAPPNVAQHEHVEAHGRRLVTRAERLYVAGTGTPADPGLLHWEGRLTHTDVSSALALP